MSQTNAPNNAIQTKDTQAAFQDLLDKILKPAVGEKLTQTQIDNLKGKCRKSVINNLFFLILIRNI